jgi:hypothetical protein
MSTRREKATKAFERGIRTDSPGERIDPVERWGVQGAYQTVIPESTLLF